MAVATLKRGEAQLKRLGFVNESIYSTWTHHKLKLVIRYIPTYPTKPWVFSSNTSTFVVGFYSESPNAAVEEFRRQVQRRLRAARLLQSQVEKWL